jgi:hypothetical protein
MSLETSEDDGSSRLSVYSREYSKDGASNSNNINSESASQDNCNKEIGDALSKNATLGVDISRAIVLLILVVTSTTICIVVYIVSVNAEYEQFNSQYDGIATKVLDSLYTFNSRMSAINSIATLSTIVGKNQTSNESLWPFVTLPAYEQRAATVLSLSRALDVSVHPIIRPIDRRAWEHYCAGPNKYWM